MIFLDSWIVPEWMRGRTLADGRRDPGEDAFLRQLAPLLGVEDRDSALARRRAARD